MSRLVCLPLLVLTGLVIPDPARSQGGASPTGLVVEKDCSQVPIIERGGEVYVQHLDGGYDDWVLNASAKRGPTHRMSAYEVDGAMYLITGFSFTRWVNPQDVYLVLTTFPEGGLHLDSGDAIWSWFSTALIQQVGDTPPQSPSSASVATRTVLPDDEEPWLAGLETGATTFPRMVDHAPEIAFAPVRELDFMYPDDCTAGGVSRDPGAEAGLLAGYNVYRIESQERPGLETLADPANWHDFIPMPPTDASQAELHDPDGWEFTGDEVLVYSDGPLALDGSQRLHGEAAVAERGRRYWYAVQPVARGLVDDFQDLYDLGRPEDDFSADLTGDGTVDSVDYDGPDSANGPEFISPQADAGEPGLGLTTGGRALLSKRMAVDFDELFNREPELRVSATRLTWTHGEAGPGLWRVSSSAFPWDLTGRVILDDDRISRWLVAGSATSDHRPAQGLTCYRVERVGSSGGPD
jgi:hypothetical protein